MPVPSLCLKGLFLLAKILTPLQLPSCLPQGCPALSRFHFSPSFCLLPFFLLHSCPWKTSPSKGLLIAGTSCRKHLGCVLWSCLSAAGKNVPTLAKSLKTAGLWDGAACSSHRGAQLYSAAGQPSSSSPLWFPTQQGEAHTESGGSESGRCSGEGLEDPDGWQHEQSLQAGGCCSHLEGVSWRGLGQDKSLCPCLQGSVTWQPGCSPWDSRDFGTPYFSRTAKPVPPLLWYSFLLNYFWKKEYPFPITQGFAAC